MTTALLERKLARAQAKIEILESMIEDKTRELFIANQGLAASLDYQRQISRILPESLLIIRSDGTIKDTNISATKLLRYSAEQCGGMPLDKVWPTSDQTLPRVQDEGVIAGMEHTWMTADGTAVPVLLSISALQAGETELEYVCVASDLRERKQLESETRHAQKLQSVGQLAAGVAHEINTPMQFIGDNVHFLRESFTNLVDLIDVFEEVLEAVPEETVAKSLVTRLEDAQEDADVDYLRDRGPQAFLRTLDGVERVSKIVAAMKSFSHPGHDKAPLDLNQAIETTLTVAANEYKYIADVELQLGDVPAVMCHSGDINQVLLNLIVNAAHAIEGQDTNDEKGTIVIRSELQGNDAVISVSDSGCGIPEAVRPRIFEPFFTTKEVGRGTGQGLALCHTIITDKHGGSLTFETEVGRGTTFFVRIPTAESASSPDAGAAA